MTELVAAGATFLALHLLISGTAVRGVVVGAIGEGPYRGLFSLSSLAAMVWMSIAYARLEPDPAAMMWAAPGWWIEAGVLVNLVALIFIVVGVTTPNPTSVQESVTETHGLVRVTRHPMLVGFAVWSAYHLSVNGDPGSVVFFGTFLITTLVGPRAIDAKRKKKLGETWNAFAEKTSIVPFVAIAQGRNRLALGEVRPGQWVAALVVFGGFYVGHGWLFGVSVLPG